MKNPRPIKSLTVLLSVVQPVLSAPRNWTCGLAVYITKDAMSDLYPSQNTNMNRTVDRIC
jgi:hypothetical protein